MILLNYSVTMLFLSGFVMLWDDNKYTIRIKTILLNKNAAFNKLQYIILTLITLISKRSKIRGRKCIRNR